MMVNKLNLLIMIALLGGIGACQCTKIKKDNLALSEAPWQEVVSYAENYLPKEGKLIQQPDGFAFIKVDDAYINELFPKLKAGEGFKKPPYFRRKDAPGAHISVIYENEKVKLQEVGQNFRFTLRDVITVHPKKGVSYIILRVDAPELEKLRERYGLTPKLKGHEFHISIAKKEVR